MDVFFMLFLFSAAVIIIVAMFRFLGKKRFRTTVSKKHPFDYLNDPKDSRSIISPLNPIGPNWVGEDNLFRDRHNHLENPTVDKSENKFSNQA